MPVERNWTRVRNVGVAIFVAASAACYAFIIAGTGSDLIDDFLGPFIFLLMAAIATVSGYREIRKDRKDKLAWIFIFAGFGFWTIGCVMRGILYPGFDSRPVPSVVDVPFLLFFPAVFIGLQLLIRIRLRSYTQGPWIDGVTGMLALAAVGAAFFVGPIDERVDGENLQAAILLAYPLGDMILLWLVAAMFSLCGWHREGPWLPLGIGIALFCLADAAFAVLGPAEDTVLQLLTPVWLAGFLFIAIATWHNDVTSDDVSPGAWQLFLPLAFALAAVIVLLAGQLGEIPLSANLLAIAALISVAYRMVATLQESKRLEITSRQAVTDELTGLANRRAVTSLLDGVAAAGGPAGVLVIDVDRFKVLNDALGHLAGDEILTSIGHNLRDAVGERGLTARMGGDEFMVVVTENPGPELLREIATDITTALSGSLQLDDLDLHVDASIGGALMPQHARGTADLMRFADAAMLRAKRLHLTYDIYRDRGGADPRARLRLIEELRAGIDSDELTLVYQPKIRLSDHHVTGAEALVRWKHPSRGLIKPDEFLHMAEQFGLMRALTREVLTKSNQQIESWHEQGLDIGVAINLAAPNLIDAELADQVETVLERFGSDPAQITFEVTENIVAGRYGVTLDLLAKLREMGCTISLDDFGAGSTSLSHLRDLPISEVKLDRTFIERILGEETDRSIVESVVDLAIKLDLTVVAEGVELSETAGFLESIGCGYIQGNLICAPLPGDEFIEWITGYDPGWKTAVPA